MNNGKVRVIIAIGLCLGLAACALLPFGERCGSGAGVVKDEALCVGRTADSFPAADEDYFADMDYGITHDPAAVAAELDPYVPGIAPAEAPKKRRRRGSVSHARSTRSAAVGGRSGFDGR